MQKDFLRLAPLSKLNGRNGGHNNGLYKICIHISCWTSYRTNTLVLLETEMSNVYKCSQHSQWLVDYVRLIRAARGQDTYLILPYYACPVFECNYIKPNKWRKAWHADPNEVIVLQLLKDGVPANAMQNLTSMARVIGHDHPILKQELERQLKFELAKCGESQ